MAVVKVGTKHQVVIPSKIFSELGLSVGDFLEAEKNGNAILLKPKKLVPKEDLWFHSKEWQEGEAEADKDLAKKRYKDFNNADDFIKDLHSK